MAMMKELRVVLGDLDERASAGQAAAVVAAELRRVYGLGVAASGHGPRRRVAAGSLGDRILGILREVKAPAPRAAILASAKARPLDVMLTLKELIADGKVKKSGVRAGTRYALAKAA